MLAEVIGFILKVAIVIAFCFVLGWFSAVINGWRRLARKYEAKNKPDGTRLRGCVTAMGWAWTGTNMINMGVSANGLYLWTNFVAAWTHPALLVLWTDIVCVREQKAFLGSVFILRAGDGVKIVVKEKAYEMMRQYLGSIQPK